MGEWKPIVAALALPPAGPLLLALLGGVLGLRWRRAGRVLALLGLVALWLLSCNAVAVWLGQHLLPQARVATPQAIKASAVQAIVVLGGGLELQAPEYGAPQLAAASLARLRYGAWLARRTGLPLAFSGGLGWGTGGVQTTSEAQAAQAALQEWGQSLRWVESQSRDTAENARLTYALLQPQRVTQVALVTHAWHMPRAQAAFTQAGFQVVAAPMGFIGAKRSSLLEWLPSTAGLQDSTAVLREWLAARQPGA